MTCDFSADIVCISERYAPATERVAMYRFAGQNGHPAGPKGDAIARLGVRIRDLHSDLILEKSTKGMSQSCLKGLCVYFIRACTLDKLTCRFIVAAADRPDLDIRFVPREFEISASSAAAFRKAEQAIKVGLPNIRAAVAIDALRTESPNDLLRKYSAWSVD